ncbi:DUF4159 domain-containing protein [Maribacter sp. 2304DJ31-5]|uniref:DUF4159 domain-containing protein n=1 Tax=Maribacter sp. 2304DJ31-5 TaxID=3386273 RepID=UPI0039BD8492
MKQLTVLFPLCVFFMITMGNGQEIAILKYQGGGDWYSNPTAVPNLIRFCNTNVNTNLKVKPKTVEAGSSLLFQYPFLYMTGHGNVVFSPDELKNLKTYLRSGGFLHIDDNYGMKPYIIREITKLFPNKNLKELAIDHPIFSTVYDFPEGLPKIHEHDGKRPQAMGLFHENRLVLLLTLESDLGDGWEDPTVHNDPEEIRQRALKMGANIVSYVFKN